MADLKIVGEFPTRCRVWIDGRPLDRVQSVSFSAALGECLKATIAFIPGSVEIEVSADAIEKVQDDG